MPGMAGRTFKLSYEISDLEFTLENERQIITAMTKEVEKLIRDRTRRGLDSSGRPFQRPKDGGTALEDTGQLKNSIGSHVKKMKARTSKKTGKITAARWVGVVRAYGRRDLSREERRDRKARARERTEAMRAEAAADFARGIIRKDLGAKVSSKTGKLKIGRVKVHGITDNAHLAAVLSVPPKDPRGIAGNRQIYRIFEASAQEIGAAVQALSRGGRFSLRPTRRKRKTRRR